MTSENLGDLLCDRCHYFADFSNGGGNCPECGDDCCISCAGTWTELADDDDLGFAVCDECLSFIQSEPTHEYYEKAKHVY